MARRTHRRHSTLLSYFLNAVIVLFGVGLVAGTLLTVRYLRLSSGGASGVASVAER